MTSIGLDRSGQVSTRADHRRISFTSLTSPTDFNVNLVETIRSCTEVYLTHWNMRDVPVDGSGLPATRTAVLHIEGIHDKGVNYINGNYTSGTMLYMNNGGANPYRDVPADEQLIAMYDSPQTVGRLRFRITDENGANLAGGVSAFTCSLIFVIHPDERK